MTARAMLLSDEKVTKVAEEYESNAKASTKMDGSKPPSTFSIGDFARADFSHGVRFARTLYEAERNRLLDEIADLKARAEAAEMVIANYLPTCVGDCGCEGERAGCAILGDDPEASAIAEEISARIGISLHDDEPIPLPEKHEEKGSDHE